MSTLMLTRGYPGSGKTTATMDWLGGDATGNPLRARSSRDAIRWETFGQTGILPYSQEQHITDLQQDAVRKLLKRGYDVVVDDLNLRRRYAVEWANLAHEQQATFSTIDFLTDVDTCVERDRWRAERGERSVGEDAIRKIAARFPLDRWPHHDDIVASVGQKSVAGSWTPYANPTTLPYIVIVDIDGTVALKSRADGSRGWHEYHRVGEDIPNPKVIEMVQLIHATGHAEIVFLSGRKDSCHIQTRVWLEDNIGDWTTDCWLHMRRADDNRSDDIVKHEIFNAEIRDQYHVVGVFDDRDRVVAMWRAVGLQVYQVAPGNF